MTLEAYQAIENNTNPLNTDKLNFLYKTARYHIFEKVTSGLNGRKVYTNVKVLSSSLK